MNAVLITGPVRRDGPGFYITSIEAPGKGVGEMRNIDCYKADTADQAMEEAKVRYPRANKHLHGIEVF